MQVAGNSSSKKQQSSKTKENSPSSPKMPTKEQIRAMEARSAMPFIPTVVEIETIEQGTAPVAAASPRPTRVRGRPAARVVPLTREQEYQFIREDMRRLVIIASGLLAIMVVLLFVIDR